MFKKLAAFLSLAFLLTTTASAREATPPGTLREKVLEKREQIKEKIQEKIQAFKNTRASLKEAKLLTKTDTVLTVSKDGITYTIHLTAKTQLRRRFWGKATLSEMAIGDLLDIQGKWADDAQTIINANLVRDTSIQLRFGTFFGTVTSISGNTIVIQPEKRPIQTVTATSSAKIINRKQQSIPLTDILAGHKIRVKGLFNNLANTITEVKEIKNFTLPIVSSPSASPKP